MNKGLQQGFTLIELVVVIVIIGILAAVAVPKFLNVQTSAQQAVLQSTCGALQSQAVIAYASAKAAVPIATIVGLLTYDTSNVTINTSGGCSSVKLSYNGSSVTQTCSISSDVCQ